MNAGVPSEAIAPENVPAEWVEAASQHYSMHGAGLIRNIIAGVAPLIAADAIKSATQEQYGDAIRTASQVFWDAAKPTLMDEIGAEVEGQIAVRETIIRAAERERIRKQIDPDRLDKLADWFDSDDEFKVAMFPGTWPERGREVQADLRRWASVIRRDGQ